MNKLLVYSEYAGTITNTILFYSSYKKAYGSLLKQYKQGIQVAFRYY